MSAEQPALASDARAKFLRRAAEARAFVARIAPELLDDAGIDETLHDLTLARSVMERFADAYRHAQGNAWLRGLAGDETPDNR